MNDEDIYDIIIALRTPEVITKEFTFLHFLIEAEFKAGTLTDEILNRCSDGECLACARIVCPYHEPLHFHHDGCPACSIEVIANEN